LVSMGRLPVQFKTFCYEGIVKNPSILRINL